MRWNICLVSLICSLYQVNWWNLMKQSVTAGAQLLWGGRYGCNNGHYGCTIVMSYIEINKAVSQWLLTFSLCVSVTWPLTCAFHISCTHTPEIIDMHRGVCDKLLDIRLLKCGVCEMVLLVHSHIHCANFWRDNHIYCFMFYHLFFAKMGCASRHNYWNFRRSLKS